MWFSWLGVSESEPESVSLLLSVVVLLYLSSSLWSYLRSRRRIPFSPSQYVLVSGCDSGFGQLLVKELHGMGWSVLAACLTSEGVKNVSRMCPGSNVHAFRMDITKEEDRQNAAKLVETKAAGKLHALVNNAGLTIQAPMDWLTMDDFHKVADVNLWGHIALTNLMMESLLAARGRVINVSSTCGFLALPGQGPYSITKWGLEAYSDVLRREMGHFGLKVSVIEPCTMNTVMVQQLVQNQERAWAKASQRAKTRWGQAFVDATAKALSQAPTVAEPPIKTVKCMIHAITSVHPQTRYLPGVGSRIFYWIAYRLPTSVTDWIVSKTIGSQDHLIAQRVA